MHLGEPLRSLPDPVAVGRHARIDYVSAHAAGTLTQAPPPVSVERPDGVRLGHRRLREPGVTAPLHHTNRDYLSAVHAIGPDRALVDAAVDEYVAGNAWAVG